MRTLCTRLFAASLLLLLAAGTALAHTPLFSCFDNGDSTITCEGGFSDGSSAANIAVLVLDAEGKSLSELALDAHSEVTFPKPEAAYTVRFDAGEGHTIDVAGKDILQ